MNRRGPYRFGAHHALAGTLAVGFFVVSYFGAPHMFSMNYDSSTASGTGMATTTSATSPQTPLTARHLPVPEPLKAIYMTSWVAGTKDFRDTLVRLIDETELNAVVIDIKDATGRIAFLVEDPELRATGAAYERIPDVRELIEFLHRRGIYVIGRISVFQDPYIARERPELTVKRVSDGEVWKDYKGLSFIDAGAVEYWDYIVKLGKESFRVGFDELNFDYVRFPSDGNMKDISYPISDSDIVLDPKNGKANVIEDFFSYLSLELRDRNLADADGRMPVLSADLFGMTATNKDDLNIGQVLERTLPHFDFVSPMVYPSHYPKTFMGYANPATKPYEVVKHSMDIAVRRVNDLKASSTTPQAVRDFVSQSQIRPWLQDFNLGATYTPDMVRAQMQATYDAGLSSWMLWDAANTYTREALLDD